MTAQRLGIEVRRFGCREVADRFAVEPGELGTFPEPADDDRRPYAWAALSLWLLIVVVALAVWLLARVDWLWLLDVIAPTAAQARDVGWVRIVEGL